MVKVIEKQEPREVGEGVLTLDESARAGAQRMLMAALGGRRVCRAPSRRAR